MDSAKDLFFSWWNAGEKPAKKTGSNSTTAKSTATAPNQTASEAPHRTPSTTNLNVNAPVQPVPEKKKKKTTAERILEFEVELTKKVISIDAIRSLCWHGIPDKPGLRALLWKILLGYLPRHRDEWESSLAKSRKLFKEFIQELVIDPRKAASVEADHPLSLDRDSSWNAYFKDNELQQEIDKDVKRTFPHLHFFREETERHPEALREILFIWAKLNPGVRYVQGMNEILGPIYYLFATDPDESFREHCEADAFFCFTNVMSEIMNNFIKTLDKSDLGIVGKMRDMTTILMQKDPQLARNLEDKNLNPQFYSFRWITLMLSQEFELPDVLRLWDSLFSDTKRFQFLLFFCCAMLVAIRERLLAGDFAENLKLLQQYPPGDIEDTIALATRLRDDEYWECPFWEPAPPAPEPVEQTVPRGESASETLTAMAKALADNVAGQ